MLWHFNRCKKPSPDAELVLHNGHHSCGTPRVDTVQILGWSPAAQAGLAECLYALSYRLSRVNYL